MPQQNHHQETKSFGPNSKPRPSPPSACPPQERRLSFEALTHPQKYTQSPISTSGFTSSMLATPSQNRASLLKTEQPQQVLENVSTSKKKAWEVMQNQEESEDEAQQKCEELQQEEALLEEENNQNIKTDSSMARHKLIKNLPKAMAFSNLLGMFVLASKIALESLLVRNVFFPIAAIIDIFTAIYAYHQAKAADFNNSGLNRTLAMAILTAIAVGGAAILLLLVGAGILALSALVAPIIFATMLSFNALKHLTTLFSELFQTLTDDTVNRRQHLLTAGVSAMGFMALGLIAATTVIVLALGMANLAYLGIIGATLGLIYAAIRTVLYPAMLAKIRLNPSNEENPHVDRDSDQYEETNLLIGWKNFAPSNAHIPTSTENQDKLTNPESPGCAS